MRSHTRTPIEGNVLAPGEARSFARAIASVSPRARRSAIAACHIGCARSGRAETGTFAVGAWLAAAIFGTRCASYANPALAPGAAGPVSLPLVTTALYMPREAAGALFALPVIALACTRRSDGRRGARLLIAPRDSAAGS
jgi:hypothetical protein